jgi:hypothetical protein
VTGLLRSELLKVTSVRMTRGLVAGAFAFVVLNVVALVLASGQPGVPKLTEEQTVRSVFGAAGSASALVLVLGIVGATTEYRHETITATFLATPRRARVLNAKLAVHAGLGFVVGLACVLLGYVLAAVLLATRTHASVSAGTLVRIALGVALGYAIYAALGVCVGALVRNQVAAIIGALLWVVLVEALVVALAPTVGRWLPGGALTGLLETNPARTVGSTGSYLSPAWAALVLIGYGVLFAVLAARTTLRRDVT